MGELMDRIRAAAREKTGGDPAHDWLHVERVERTARQIALQEGADGFVVSCAASLHELVNLPKGHPDSHRSGELCSDAALAVLSDVGVETSIARRIAECIRVHGWSAGLEPPHLEAAIVQDADRLDAIGAIGIARCFATCASMNRPFYDAGDPFAERRALDDRSFGLDHFYRKLLRIPARLHTESARKMGESRAEFLRVYLEQLKAEIGQA